MTVDDALFRFRVRVFALAEEMGSVRGACRAMGVHPSTFYRWKRDVERYGLEVLRPRERRHPRMPNATPMLIEQRVLGFALAHPGFGPSRISAELARDKRGAIAISPNGVWRVLRRHGLNTRAKRLSLVAGYAAPPEPQRDVEPEPERHIDAENPGDVVQFDCFQIGRLHNTAGVAWQYTAIDVASSYTWLRCGSRPRTRHHAGPSCWHAVSPRTWPTTAGSCARSRPTAATSSVRSSSPTPSPSSAPITSGCAGHSPMGVSNASSSQPQRVLAAGVRTASDPQIHRARSVL